MKVRLPALFMTTSARPVSRPALAVALVTGGVAGTALAGGAAPEVWSTLGSAFDYMRGTMVQMLLDQASFAVACFY